MREIKYRGKSVGNGQWVYGYYLKHETRQISPIGEDKLSDDEVMHLIARDGFADWNMPRQIEFVKVDPKTVGQYTGMKDKNGVEICEGDTIKRNSATYVVEFSEVRRGWYPFAIDDGCGCCACDVERPEEVEVIGNIHDSKGEEHGE